MAVGEKKKRRIKTMKNKDRILVSFFIIMFSYCAKTAYCKDFEQRLLLKEQNSAVEIRNGYIYVKGEMFYVKGIGYQGWRPPQIPWIHKKDTRVLENDFARIKDTGFNTIRTWKPMTDDELELAKKHNLMVIQGIWIDQNGDFCDPVFLKNSIETVKNEIKRGMKHDNILIYLVMNEPNGDRAANIGNEKMTYFLKELYKAGKSVNPNAIISFSSYSKIDTLDHSFWDVVCFNVYMYPMATVKYVIGYQEYLNWLKDMHAPHKPLLITEFGLSVSPTGEGDFGYGGNTEEQQKEGIMHMLESHAGAQLIGGCVFVYMDMWWSVGSPDVRDDNPEEWFGIIALNDKNNFDGTPRKAFHAVKEYNTAILINPKSMQKYYRKIPIQVYAEESVVNVSYKMGGLPDKELKKVGRHWWVGRYLQEKVENKYQTITIKALDNKDNVYIRKRDFEIADKIDKEDEIKIVLNADKVKYKKGEFINIVINASANYPIKGQAVKIGIYNHRTWDGIFEVAKLDEDGKASYKCSTSYWDCPDIVTITAAIRQKEDGYEKIFYDTKIVEVVK